MKTETYMTMFQILSDQWGDVETGAYAEVVARLIGEPEDDGESEFEFWVRLRHVIGYMLHRGQEEIIQEALDRLSEIYEDIKPEPNSIGKIRLRQAEDDLKNPYVICDCEDGEIFWKGTLDELKELWWNKLRNDDEVGGYALMDRAKHRDEFTIIE